MNDIDLILTAAETGELPKSGIRVAEKLQNQDNIIIRPGVSYSEFFNIPESDAPAIMEFLEENQIIKTIKPNRNE